MHDTDSSSAPRTEPEIIRRHSLATRLLHWINAACVFLILMSGLQIFNAHPHLYWGQYGANSDKAWVSINGGFPPWATIPGWRDLATGRRWHFFFAWLVVFNSVTYLLISLRKGHVQRDLLPQGSELSPAHLLRDIWDHVRLRFPRGAAAKRYNILQKLAYTTVIFGLAPLMLLTGLAMSPGFDAACPWLLSLFGGRQSARSIHFVVATLIVLFIVVHLLMVLLAGPWNELRSMVTGRFVVRPEKPR